MKSLFILVLVNLFHFSVYAEETRLINIKNYQQVTTNFASAGMPTNKQLETIKQQGFTHIINLIPGDFSDEQNKAAELKLDFTQIPVDWHNPTVGDFQQFVKAMTKAKQQNPEAKILLHCQLNYRASAFAYLYQVTQAGQDNEQAKLLLNKIWQPEGKWQQFVDDVIAAYH